MKKCMIFLILLFLIIPISFGDVIITRDMPEKAELGETITISIHIYTTEELERFDVVEFVPAGWDVIDWEVHNYDRSSIVFERVGSRIYEGRRRVPFHWYFRDSIDEGEVIISYEIKVIDRGEQEFITYWMHPDETFDQSFSTIEVVRTDLIPPFEFPDYDLRPLVLILAILSSAAIIFYLHQRRKERGESKKKGSQIEDLRVFIKLGLERGYRLKELVHTLKGEGIDTELIEKLILKDGLKDLKKKKTKVYPEDKVIQKIKKIVEKMSKEEKEKIYKKLEK